MNLPIYLDNHATTQLDPRVLEAMMPSLTHAWGNAASNSHSFGWAAQQAVESARVQVAQLIGANAKEVVFTSGATESNNLALKGAVEAARQAQPGRSIHIITQASEHKAVLDPCAWLAQHGCRVTVLRVNREGFIDLDDLRRALDAETVLVSIMAANNEVGALQPIEAIGALCRERGVLFHTDAAQAAGKVALNVARANIDLLSISGHKLYGPKGVGALYVRRGVKVAEQMHGGGHERGTRSGTLNVPAIVGLGAACALAAAELEAETARLSALRERLRTQLLASLERVRVNGPGESGRLPGNLSVTFDGVDSESLMMGLKDVAVSSGSACTSASIQASHVLRALGLSDDEAHSTLRFGIGRFNTQAEIDYVAQRIVEVVPQLRELSPAWAEIS